MLNLVGLALDLTVCETIGDMQDKKLSYKNMVIIGTRDVICTFNTSTYNINKRSKGNRINIL